MATTPALPDDFGQTSTLTIEMTGDLSICEADFELFEAPGKAPGHVRVLEVSSG